MSMGWDVGSVWVTIKANVDGLVSGLNLSQEEMRKWRDQTNEASRDTLKWARALTYATGPFILAGYVSYQQAQKYGEIAQNINKMSKEMDQSTYSVQQLTNAQKGLNGVPVYTDEDLERMEHAKLSWDVLIESVTVYSGKFLGYVDDAQTKINNLNPVAKYLEQYLGKVGTTSEVTAKKGKVLNDWLEDVAENAEEAAKRIKDAESSLKGLSRTIEGLEGSTTEERGVQSGLGEEYRRLEAELAGLDPAIYGDTATITETSNRRIAIKARMREIELQMGQSAQTVRYNTEDTKAAREAAAANVQIIIHDKTIAGVQAQILTDAQEAAWQVLYGNGGSY